MRIESRDAVAAFQERVRGAYPLFEQGSLQMFQLQVGAGNPAVTPVSSSVWRFLTADRQLSVALTSDSITLQAHTYEGREAFIGRWGTLLEHLEAVFTPSLVLRTGARYVNRLTGESLHRLADLVQPNLVGVALPDLRVHVTQAVSEANMTVEEGQLMLRWGVLPVGVTFDSSLLPPAAGDSWVLDIDIFNETQKPFSGNALAEEFRTLGERAYSVFRWVITEAGMTHFGARS